MMDVNSDSICETTATPFARLPIYGRATVKGSTLDHYRLYDAGAQLSPRQPEANPPAGELEVPAKPATSGLKNTLPQISAAPLPAASDGLLL